MNNTTLNIIIADDHTLFASGIEMLLKAKEPQWKVIAKIPNGTEVLKALAQKPLQAQVLLLDINMPETNGIEVIRYIIKNNIPIKTIVLSMYQEPSFVRQVIKEGANAYLTKNTTDKELFEAIETVLQSKEYIGEALREDYKNLDEDKIVLSERELEVLRLLAQGQSTKLIADKLFISTHTVESHRKNLLKKTESKNTAELIKYAISNQLLI